MDSHGDIWITDFSANRVLEFRPPFSNGEAASIVIGQTTFAGDQSGASYTNLSHPAGTAFDAKGDLWVTDWGNNRVLEYLPPFSTGMAASLVLGQSNFAGNLGNATAKNLSGPVGPTFDAAGDLWISDEFNARVLEFVPPFSTGMAASLVIGQSTFTGVESGLTAYNLSYPQEALVSGDTLWIADYGNNRVLGYYAPFYTGEAAEIVLGQNSYTTSSSTGEAAFEGATGVQVDAFGNLWVTDQYDNRVLEFSPPFSSFQDPIVAIGQASLTGTSSGTTATTLASPQSSFFDGSGDLWVTDTENDRLLEYVPTHYAVTVTPSGLPAGTSWTVSVDGQSETGTGSLHFSETNGTFSLQVTPVAGLRANPSLTDFVVDASATVVTVQFTPAAPNPFSSGMPASIVLGQPNFNTATVYADNMVNASSNAGDWGATFDKSGNLWVADEAFNRVLEFHPPFTNFMAASLVLGQSSFSGTASGDTAQNLSSPNGLTFDASGDLWVSDSGNNRVIEFVPPFTTGMAASLVIGQHGFGTQTGGNGPAELEYPFGLAFSGGNLWVTDSENNRVLEYLPPFSTGESATSVLGQSNLTGYFSGLSATNLSDASWLAFDSHGNVWVSDWANNRVLEFLAPLTTGEAATVVLGQPNMTTNSATYPDSLFYAGGIWIDGHGDVWVADDGNNRVLEYIGPTSSIVTNQTPALVIGQGNLSTDGASTSRTGLDGPTDVLGNAAGDLWVVDDYNDRILSYDPTPFDLNFTAIGLPTGTSWGVSVNGTALVGSGPSVMVSEENGTYNWTATPVPGWAASPSSGFATINGGVASATIVYTPFDFVVTFTEKGLAAGTTWSVTVAGVAHPSTGTTIAISEPNGSYPYTVAAVVGYTSTNGTGVVLVDAAAAFVTVTFSSPSPSGSGGSSGLSTTDLIILALVVVIVAAAIAVVVVGRRKKGGPTAPTAWAPPAGVGGPPPGASQPPQGVTAPPPPPAPPAA